MVTMFGWDKRLAARALALEAPDHLRGRDDFGADELERNGFAEHDMGRPVHGAHAAPTEEALDPVFPAQGLSAEPFLGRQFVLEDAAIMGAEPLAHHELPATGGAGAHLAWDRRAPRSGLAA
jgi:hypothetical protein